MTPLFSVYPFSHIAMPLTLNAYLDSVFPDADVQATLMNELALAVRMPEGHMRKFLIFVGPGCTGISTFMRLIKKTFSTHQLQFRDMASAKFCYKIPAADFAFTQVDIDPCLVSNKRVLAAPATCIVGCNVIPEMEQPFADNQVCVFSFLNRFEGVLDLQDLDALAPAFSDYIAAWPVHL
jgi:hypothetical protein